MSSQNDAADRLAGQLVAGDKRALARAISLAEDRSPVGRAVLAAVWPRTGKAHRIGITGPPGAGKSTLADRLAAHYLAAGKKVGIIAVDPSSAFSGGAILGDRIRMADRFLEPNVFIRSMATRGHMGGLSRAATDAADLLDAAGYDLILLETVGVGQDEVEVIEAAQTVVVVLVPGLGDDIQAIKAGLMEIADIYVINKSDREGAEKLESEIQTMMSLSSQPRDWEPPILHTVATRDEGIAPLAELIARHRAQPVVSERQQRSARVRLARIVAEKIGDEVDSLLATHPALQARFADFQQRRADPYSTAASLLEEYIRSASADAARS
jgi:LAO/AO transport system kinase